MTTEEFNEKLNEIQKKKCESTILEIKAAAKGCPKRLYDTLSAFSNQDDGGVIVFGVDEEAGYLEQGVYDAQDLQKKINEQCLQMEPVVRPLITVVQRGGKNFVAAEIPGMDIAERPCYYKGQGRVRGSYVRVGDSDEPMTEYEVYSYEAFRKKYQDDIRAVQRATPAMLDAAKVDSYIALLKEGKPNLANMADSEIKELMSITRTEAVTLNACILFCPYPQAFFPQLCITAVAIPGREMGEVNDRGARFTDNRRIEGSIPQMLDGALLFMKRNMKKMTIINAKTGLREDRTEYPITAVREAILNALVHRDYSIHTEGMPIQIRMFEDRLEIRSPGGIYGRLRVNQLGKVQPDTRNPVLAAALEVLGVTENRYSGIPTMRRELCEYGLQEPEFTDNRNEFCVCFYNEKGGETEQIPNEIQEPERDLVLFCRTPRSRKEICNYLELSSSAYAMKKHVQPLIDAGVIHMTIPEKPKSAKQMYYSVPKNI